MFGAAKPTGFGTAFGAGASSSAGFGASFGASTPAANTGLFGATPTSSTGTSLFGGGGGTAATGFGGTGTGFNFGGTPTATSTTGGLFGQKPQQASTAGGLFGTPTSSNAFGAKTPAAFGGTFGATTTTASGGLFGATPTAGGGLFGTTPTAAGFGQQQSGTVVKFNPLSGQDTMVKNGVTTNINTKHQCITAMKEYEGKSLEELRVEDYLANRKGKQGGATPFFGATPVATQANTGFTFGNPASSSAFGASGAFGTTNTTTSSLFGQTPTATATIFGAAKPFGAATTTQGGFGFGTNTSSATSLFGQPQTSKAPFGFGATPAATTQQSLFGGTSTFGTPASSSTFGGAFGATTQAGGLFGAKPGFGTQTTASTGGFSFGGANPGAASLFAKPFSQPSAFGGLNTATSSTGFGTGTFAAAKPAGFGFNTSTATPSFNFGASTAGVGGCFGGIGTLAKPAGFGNLSTTTAFPGGFGAGTGFNLGGAATTLGASSAPAANNNAAQLQQTLLTLTHSPYGDSPLFWNMKQASTKREEMLKPTNPAAQKAVLASLHKVSSRPAAKIKPKSLHGVMNNSKSQIFEGLEDDDYSFGNDTFMPRKSVKKLVLRKSGVDSNPPSRATSVSGDPPNMASLRDEETYVMGRGSPELVSEPRPEQLAPVPPDSENLIRSKGISEYMTDAPNRNETMDDTIAILNARNKPASIPPMMPPLSSQEEIPDISIVSHDDSTTDNDTMNERPMTPPPPHAAGIVLTRPGYYTVPSLDDLSDMVDDVAGDCCVEDLTIGREGYGSVFFPGITNVANMNIDEIVFFRRKEVIVYPDDELKPPLGEGLNKKAEITLDCVWPRDKSLGTPVKSPEKLAALRWQDKIEENSLKVGAKFIDYRPETGSWVFEVKHFSKYGLVEDSDDEDLPDQEKKRLKLAQQQQMAVQKQKVQLEQLERQRLLKEKAALNGHQAQFTIGTEDDQDSSTRRREVPMGDDDNQLSEISQTETIQDFTEMGDDHMDMHDEPPSSHRLATSMGVDARNMQVMKASFFGDDEMQPAEFGGQLFGKKPSKGLQPSLLRPGTQSPLLRHAESSGPSLFSSALKSKYMSPVKLPGLPQKDLHMEPNMFSPRLITPEPLRPSQPTFHPPVKEHLILASGMTPQDIQKKIVGTRVTRVIPPVKQSYLYHKEKLLVDAGLFMGRSFRVGWGPGWTLVHAGEPVVPKDPEQEKPGSTFNLFTPGHTKPAHFGRSDWKVTLQKIHIADHIHAQDTSVIQYHREMLEVQLEHSESSVEGDVPVFTPSMGVGALHSYAEKNKEELENLGGHPDEATVQHTGIVWDLCVALWGNMPELNDIDVGRDSYMYHSARREAFSRWLASVSGDVIKQEVQANKYKDQGHLQSIVSALSGRQIAEACQLAQKSGDHKLALCVAQAVCNYAPRGMISKQLNEWIELGVNNYMHETRLKIYSIVSGQLMLEAPGLTVNSCEGFDWKRALALHLWYCCPLETSIQEAVDLYEKSFNGRSIEYGPSCAAPLPPYLEGSVPDSDLDLGDEGIRDTCYHLLTLYCQRCNQLERLLNPTTSTASHLDYRLSWHLSQVLQSLNYKHLSDYHRACLHMNFVSHLESIDMWEWAVFVALHIENPVSRENAVRSVLNRNIQLSSHEDYLEKEALLREKLMVPNTWIHYAKALRASYEGRPRDEAWHLMKAGQWNQCHQIVLRHIAPDAIIHEKYEYLLKFLAELNLSSRSSTILDWHIGGRVYLDYITVCQTMDQLKEMEDDTESELYELDRLLPEVKSLCTKIGSIQCRNSKDRLCQSEMARKVASMLKQILTMQCEARGESQPPIRLLAPYISSLPMPEDYMLQELRALTRSYMAEQSAS